MQSRTYIKQVLNGSNADTVFLLDSGITSKFKIKDNIQINTPEERGLININGIKWIVPTADVKFSLTGISFVEDKSQTSYIALDSLKEQKKQKKEQKQENQDQELNGQLKENQK